MNKKDFYDELLAKKEKGFEETTLDIEFLKKVNKEILELDEMKAREEISKCNKKVATLEITAKKQKTDVDDVERKKLVDEINKLNSDINTSLQKKEEIKRLEEMSKQFPVYIDLIKNKIKEL